MWSDVANRILVHFFLYITSALWLGLIIDGKLEGGGLLALLTLFIISTELFDDSVSAINKKLILFVVLANAFISTGIMGFLNYFYIVTFIVWVVYVVKFIREKDL